MSTGTRFNIDDVLGPVGDRRLGRFPELLRTAVTMCLEAGRREFLALLVVQVVGGVAVTGQLLATRWLLDRVLQVGGGELMVVVAPLVAIAGSTAIVALTGIARTESSRLMTELVGRHATRQLVEVATAIDLVAYDSTEFHDRLQRAKVNAVVRPVQLASGVLSIASGAFALVGVGAALLVLEPLLVALVLLGYAPAWFASRQISRLGYRFAVDQTERDRKRSYLLTLLTTKESASEMRSFELSGPLADRHDHLYEEKIQALRHLVRRRLVVGAIGGLLNATMTVVALAALLLLVGSGRLELAEAGAAAAAMLLLAQRLQVLAAGSASLYEASLFMEDFTSFVASLPNMIRHRAAQPLGPGFDTITVDTVSFTYPDQDLPAVREVSLEILRGEVIALVGENGSGKTTLAKLLAGLYEPDEGQVRWDGVDVRLRDPSTLRRQVAVLFQDFVRYHLTVRENIAFGRVEDEPEDAAVHRAAAQAGISSLIDSLDGGLSTVLGPEYFGGRDLSGGQWQGVAMARGFIRDAPLLILDEPTAALDPRAEFELFERIRELQAGRTVVLISHRFANVRHADRIYVLHQGRIVEDGPHDELIRIGGRYAELFGLQASAYQAESGTAVDISSAER